jgi:hypothetical protein
MTRVVRNAALLCVAGILVASAALANVPDPAKSSLQSAYIAVEGSTSGNPDNCSDGRCGNFTVTVRDFANNVIAGSTVVIDFSGCSDIQVSCDQLNAVTGQSYLAGKKVSGTTNAAGQFTFKVQGASNAVPTVGNTTSAGTNVNVPCAQVYADGVPLTPALIVAAYDLNGLGSPSGAVNGADASLIAAEVAKIPLGAQARARDDYNNSGTVNGADAAAMAAMVSQASLGTGSQKTSPFCP